MNLQWLGYNDRFDAYRHSHSLTEYQVGRVVAEHKERYIVRTEHTELEAEITGNLRFSAAGREDFPAVGDWVALTVYEPDFAIIHAILPRHSVISRQAVGQFGAIQIIAVNVDVAFLVQAVDRDFNPNRLERYLTLCYAAKVQPIILLTKTDLIDKPALEHIIETLRQRLEKVPVIALSNTTRDGYEALTQCIEPGKTYCMLGSSGVGKSSLINNLAGRTIMETKEISESTRKGRHTTSHRELVVLDRGGLLIDNPGMREVGIADLADGTETAFDKIAGFASQCRFADCRHTSELGCAVLQAVEAGELDRLSYENYLKIEREKAWFESTVAEKRKKEKVFGKIQKDYYKKDIKQKNI